MLEKRIEEKDLPGFAKEILGNAKEVKIFIFIGNLGTGKTTLIKELCLALGIEGQTSSPTYSIVNEYFSSNDKFYHIDLYRLKSLNEAFEIGIEEYLESHHYCFIEWPDVIMEILPNNFIQVEIKKIDNFVREYKISKSDIYDG